jgi:hypothetical protein
MVSVKCPESRARSQYIARQVICIQNRSSVTTVVALIKKVILDTSPRNS